MISLFFFSVYWNLTDFKRASFYFAFLSTLSFILAFRNLVWGGAPAWHKIAQFTVDERMNDDGRAEEKKKKPEYMCQGTGSVSIGTFGLIVVGDNSSVHRGNRVGRKSQFVSFLLAGCFIILTMKFFLPQI